MSGDPRLSVVVLTHNRVRELERTLGQLHALPERPQIVVADNASTDGTADRVRLRFPEVVLVACPHNLGAAARNAAVRRVRSPYVAFCDDDGWWAPGALARAADLLDRHRQVGVVAARVLVGEGQRLDPTCERMARSPLPSPGLPGPALASFMAGAAVMRTRAFWDAGGYEPRLFLGAEEVLLALDLWTHGWHIVYAEQVVAHHHPSPHRDAARWASLRARNRIWTAWLRLPLLAACRETARALRSVADPSARAQVWRQALRGLPWALAHRRAGDEEAVARFAQVFGEPPARMERPSLA